MSERDEKIIAALARYDAAPVGSQARLDAAFEIEKFEGKCSERDLARVTYEYAKRTGKEERKV